MKSKNSMPRQKGTARFSFSNIIFVGIVIAWALTSIIGSLLVESSPDSINKATRIEPQQEPILEQKHEKLIESLSTLSESQQRSAIVALGDSGDIRAVEPLLKLLHTNRHFYSQKRYSIQAPLIFEALGKLGDKRALDPLLKDLTQNSEKDDEVLIKLGATKSQLISRHIQILSRGPKVNFIRERSVKRLAELADTGDIRTIKALSALIGYMNLEEKTNQRKEFPVRSSVDVKRSVYKALERIGDEKAIEIIINDIDKSVSKWLYFDAGQKGIGRLKGEEDQIMFLLNKMGQPTQNQLVRIYKILLYDASTRKREQEVLSEISSLGIKEQIINEDIHTLSNYKLNSKGYPADVFKALERLRTLGVRRAIDSIVNLLNKKNINSTWESQIFGALHGLEPTHDQWLRAYSLLLVNGDSVRRRSAATYLGDLGDSQAVESLITALKDESSIFEVHSYPTMPGYGYSGNNWTTEVPYAVRIAAIEALEKLGDSRAVEPLITLLDLDGQIVYRYQDYVIKALGNIGDKRAIKPIMDYINKEISKDTMELIRNALIKLGASKREIADAVKAGKTRDLLIIKNPTMVTLFNAIDENNYEVVELILKSGRVDINESEFVKHPKEFFSRNYYTPLSYAVMSDNVPMVRLLISKGANISPAYGAYDSQVIRPGNLEMFKLLYGEGGYLDELLGEKRQKKLNTLVAEAADIGANEIFDYLLKIGARIYSPEKGASVDHTNVDIIISAALDQNNKHIETIIINEAKGNLDLARSILWVAINKSRPDIAGMILEKSGSLKQSISTSSKLNHEPWHTSSYFKQAILNNNYEMVKVLVENGMNLDINGIDAWEYAEEKNASEKIQEYLKSKFYFWEIYLGMGIAAKRRKKWDPLTQELLEIEHKNDEILV